MNLRPLILLGLAASVAALAACSAPAADTVATPPAVASPHADGDATEPTTARTVPDACAGLPLEAGGTLDGAALGACVAVALSSYGSGRMEMTTDATGEVEFTYDPDYAFQGTFAGPSGDMRLAFVDGVMWMDTGAGPVRGDVSSDDPEEMMVGVTGEMYRAYSDLQETAKLIHGQPVWNIAAATEQVALPNGTSLEAYRITSAGAFTWHEMPVSEFVLWFTEDWVPVATEATMAVAGMESTQSQRFYDLGADITVQPLG